MATEALVLFLGVALALAALLMFMSTRTARRQLAECERARARAEAARLDAERARWHRIHWEARLAEQRDAIVHGGDPRSRGDGLGLPDVRPRTGRFARIAAAPSLLERG